MSDENPIELCSQCWRPNPFIYNYRGRKLCHDCLMELMNNGLGLPDVTAQVVKIDDPTLIECRFIQDRMEKDVHNLHQYYALFKSGMLRKFLDKVDSGFTRDSSLKSVFKEFDIQLMHKYEAEFVKLAKNFVASVEQPDEEEKLLSGGMTKLKAGLMGEYRYTDALTSLTTCLAFWKSDKGSTRAGRMLNAMATNLNEDVESFRKIQTNSLIKSDPYFISNYVCSLIEATYDQLPDFELSADLFMSSDGWVYLEKPFLLPPASNDPSEIRNLNGPIPSIRVIHWSFVKNNGVQIMTYEQTYPDNSIDLSPLTIGYFGIGDNWKKTRDLQKQLEEYKIEPEVAIARLDLSVLYTISLLCFMRQPILAFSRERPNRADRKRFKKEFQYESPLIKVIVLRAKKYISRANDNEGSREIEWNSRWWVRGHWRHFHIRPKPPIWIPTYIKGPDDKPLKTPKNMIFDIKR